MKKFDFENFTEKSSLFFNSRFKRVDSVFSPLKLTISMAALFVALGVGVALFPAFFGFILGSFFIVFGFLFAMLAWKVYCLKRKFDQFFSSVPKTVVIQRPLTDVEMNMADLEEDLKKVTWH